MRVLAAALGVAALLITSASAARPARLAHPARASLCSGGEHVVYSCRFGTKLGSVCLGKTSLHYRFGPPGHPSINLASAPDWSNIHTGGNRSQGGLNQDSIRFTNGTTHYVVHSDETGALNENPGRSSSGIEVLQGASGERQLASLSCKARTRFSWKPFGDISQSAPDTWDGAETSGGPFDMVY